MLALLVCSPASGQRYMSACFDCSQPLRVKLIDRGLPLSGCWAVCVMCGWPYQYTTAGWEAGTLDRLAQLRVDELSKILNERRTVRKQLH